jgi:hypothetical protein
MIANLSYLKLNWLLLSQPEERKGFCYFFGAKHQKNNKNRLPFLLAEQLPKLKGKP